jgi:hypothetical protein
MLYKHHGFTVEVTDATQHATCYDPDGKPVATLVRRRVLAPANEKAWRAYLTNGNELCSRYSTWRSLFRDIVLWERLRRFNEARREQEMVAAYVSEGLGE